MGQLFRIWLGVTEYLFRNERLLDEVINTAIEDDTFRSDDLEFTFAARVSLFTSVLCSRVHTRRQVVLDLCMFQYRIQINRWVASVERGNDAVWFHRLMMLVSRLGLNVSPLAHSMPIGTDSQISNNILPPDSQTL